MTRQLFIELTADERSLIETKAKEAGVSMRALVVMAVAAYKVPNAEAERHDQLLEALALIADRVRDVELAVNNSAPPR